jgi:hypothetical protein
VLEDLPAEPTLSAHGGRVQVELVAVICELDDLDAWRAYLRVARGSEINQRAAILDELRYFDHASNKYLAFLAAFLDDEMERDITPSAGEYRFPKEQFPVISVGNLAVKVLAQLLKVKPSPEPGWTPAQWSTLRDQVRERLKEEKLPKLE